MLFDLAPKENREDLYDFDEPFERLSAFLQEPVERTPLIVVKGMRRTGKTSLIKTALNELELTYLYVDGREFAAAPVITKLDLMRELERELNLMVKRYGKWRTKFFAALRGVRWIKLTDKFPFLHFEWRRPSSMDILDLVQAFQVLSDDIGTRTVLVLDEAQHFSRLADYRLQYLLAHIYDHVHEIQIIISGSEVGLLYDFLETDNPDAPLFGRGMGEITVPWLPRESALDFLQQGCRQARLRVPPESNQKAVDELNGTIGWLTLYGHELMKGIPPETALMRTIEQGSALEAQELEHFLTVRKQGRSRYLAILKAAARLDRARWIDLKTNLETVERKRITDRRFNSLLQNLLKANFLTKEGEEYFIPDPLLKHALLTDLIR
jgi:AAA+ ATPase superfamily predicted ATPase